MRPRTAGKQFETKINNLSKSEDLSDLNKFGLMKFKKQNLYRN